MARWWCNNCEEYFEEPETVKELHTELDGNWCETFCACPNCHDINVVECIDKCDLCGTLVRNTTYVGSWEICPDCWETLRDVISDAADTIVAKLDTDRLTAEGLIGDFFADN